MENINPNKKIVICCMFLRFLMNENLTIWRIYFVDIIV